MKIFVNGEPVEWSGSIIDYGGVLALAKQPEGASVMYSSPKRGDMQRSGILHAKSQPIVLEDGMRFSAVRTNNA